MSNMAKNKIKLNRLNELRAFYHDRIAKKHFTQAQLGNRVGRTQAWVSMMFAGKVAPTAEMVQIMASDMGLSISDFYSKYFNN